ncbi:MAG: sensor histidine kinase [Pseudomonadota bacterium]|uniref:sensor histidine kinase n=1 Tax=Thermithiobacillus tepidarius TaxID=929 RepID=UPI00138B18C8|nr:PAS domain S-box protein [Thermithiobacillus tepidarius]
MESKNHAFLAEAVAVLAESLDYERTLQNVASLAISQFCDFCMVDMLDHDRAFHELVFMHRNPVKEALVAELKNRYPYDPEGKFGIYKVLRTRRAELITEMSDVILTLIARDEVHLAGLRQLEVRSFMCVPLMARGRLLGAITFMITESERRFGPADLAVAEQLAHFAALAVDNARLYSELRAAEQELRHQLNFTFSLTHSLGEGVCALDEAGRLTFMNPAAEEMLGYSKEEVLGMPLLGFVCARYGGDAGLPPECPLSSVATSGRTLQYDGDHFIRRDGSTFPVSCTASPIRMDQEVRGIVLAFRDVTEKQQAEAAVLALNAELEQRVAERTAELTAANQELMSFSYSVSHDLRAPLRGIDGFSLALLEDYGEVLDDTGKSYLHRIRGGAQRMSELIDALLGLSRVTRADMHVERVDLSRMAAKIEEQMVRIHPERRVDFRIAERLLAQGDGSLLWIALENLLGNAWKFTRKQADARIEFGMREQDGQPVYFVRDNGAGFDMAYADKLFGAFQRLHSPGEFEGHGIGLATVARIIARHGGRIWAEGAVGQGATFYFTLGEFK